MGEVRVHPLILAQAPRSTPFDARGSTVTIRGIWGTHIWGKLFCFFTPNLPSIYLLGGPPPPPPFTATLELPFGLGWDTNTCVDKHASHPSTDRFGHSVLELVPSPSRRNAAGTPVNRPLDPCGGARRARLRKGFFGKALHAAPRRWSLIRLPLGGGP